MLAGGNQSPKMCISEQALLHGVRRAYLETLSEVCHFQTRSFVELRQINEELMRNASVFVLVAQVVMALETTGHVVRVEKRNLGGLSQAIAAQHLDVRPRNEIDGSASERCCGNGIDCLRALHRYRWVSRKEGSEMFRDADGPEL